MVIGGASDRGRRADAELRLPAAVQADPKLAFLADPRSYPEGTGAVRVHETHMSWIFLTDTRVYKLKKAISARLLDFRRLSDREFFCREELRLNRRLAASVYLAVLPVSRRGEGGFVIGGDGEIVDWLVAMRRLPAERMLDVAIAAGSVIEGQAKAAADLLAAFYAGLDTVPMTGADYLARFAAEAEESLSVLAKHAAIGFDGRLEAIGAGARRALAALAEELAARANAGRIVEGHGDLRPEHVCLEDPPVVIDCLEFSRALRLVDPLDELAFLGMECARLGCPWIEPILFAAAANRIPDWDAPARLVAFYKLMHALTRARLAALHLEEVPIRTPEKWPRQARTFIGIAAEQLAVLEACARRD